jgi:alkylhydroperoxidase/carboxymuconolactone decarboxylase family protein YurZ
VENHELLRRLALDDPVAVRAVVGAEPPPRGTAALDPQTAALVRLGALLSIGAPTASCRAAVDVARAAGAGDEHLVSVLIAIAPVVGAARVVAAAPALALAIDYDVEGVDDRWEEDLA